eukprot:UN18337
MLKLNTIKSTLNSECYRLGTTPILLTCEHASNTLPNNYNWGLNETVSKEHWAYDPGAAEITLELAKTLSCSAVLSRYSRLFCDVNRHVSSDTLIRKQCDGIELDINKNMSDNDNLERFRYYVDR